ncbi:MAG: NAD(P)/FAD-dependent oxidoreductase [Elusimicrobia bacterium]|nr:NAD(P)/FAD-dependent oxidoreductase [Elusimicrobiota bacterium]
MTKGSSEEIRKVDALIVGSGPAAAACAKRLVDAGYETVALERKALPRHKACSGILSPRGHRFLIENFGPLPKEILHTPSSAVGVTFHFPGMLSLSMNFDGGPTPHLHRKYADHWAMRRSGAEIHDLTEFTELQDKGAYVDVTAMKDERTVRYRARRVIGADGPGLSVVRSLYPDYAGQIPWFVVGQKFHAVIACPLDDRYFHFWFHPQLGHYTWSHARDGKQLVGVGFLKGENFDVRHQRVVQYLEHRHQVKLGPAESPEIVPANFGGSLINRYIFGKGNVLITGQAAGFFNMIAEGMSCALHSGAIAGEAAVESFRNPADVQRTYRAMIASEVRRCSDQWNPLEIAFGRPHEADFRGALNKLKVRERLSVLREILSFIKLYAPLNWGRQILRHSVYRQVLGRYDSARWL